MLIEARLQYEKVPQIWAQMIQEHEKTSGDLQDAKISRCQNLLQI